MDFHPLLPILFMSKRSQLPHQRPQNAYKTFTKPKTYSRTERDEKIATHLMSKRSEHRVIEHKEKTVKREIKQLAKTVYTLRKLGRWVHIGDDSTYIIEPSKYFSDKYVMQFIPKDCVQSDSFSVMWGRGVERQEPHTELLNIEELTERFVGFLNDTRYKFLEPYDSYKENKTLITCLSPEEQEYELVLEQQKREKFAEPFLAWLTN